MVGEETDVFSLVTFCAGFSITTPPELFGVGLLSAGLLCVGLLCVGLEVVVFLSLSVVVLLEALLFGNEVVLSSKLGNSGFLASKQPERVIKNIATSKQQIIFLNI